MKLIAIDMDGTLLNDENIVTTNQLEFLIDLSNADDYTLAMATGRPIEGIKRMLPQKLHERVYKIALNGALLLGKDDEVICADYISHDNFNLVLSYADEVQGKVCVLDEYRYYHTTKKMTELMEYDVSLLKMEMEYLDIEEVANKEDITKILIFVEEGLMKQARESIPTELYDSYEVIFSQDWLIEFLPKGVNKGTSLKRLMEKLDIETHKVYGIGDGLNDIALLQTSGHAVAMGNSKSEILKIADFISRDNNSDGVKYAIENYVFKGDTEIN